MRQVTIRQLWITCPNSHTPASAVVQVLDESCTSHEDKMQNRVLLFYDRINGSHGTKIVSAYIFWTSWIYDVSLKRSWTASFPLESERITHMLLSSKYFP